MRRIATHGDRPITRSTSAASNTCEAVRKIAFTVSAAKQLYDRSGTVHGGTFNESAISERANGALDLARSSLRVLVADRHEVLSLPDGSARSLRLILDG